MAARLGDAASRWETRGEADQHDFQHAWPFPRAISERLHAWPIRASPASHAGTRLGIVMGRAEATKGSCW